MKEVTCVIAALPPLRGPNSCAVTFGRGGVPVLRRNPNDRASIAGPNGKRSP
jgi:hypothetical protein